jgi:glutamyl-tRNA synthetase
VSEATKAGRPDLFHPDSDPGRAPGRYAPSPTGRLHLGNLRTALLAWRSARGREAPFLIRVEDIDSGRSREEWVEVQLEELRQIGIDWDGEPVRQSRRHGLYEEALDQLASEGLLYECFCTRAEIREAASAPHSELPEHAYPGTCRDLTTAEREARRASGRPPALRIRAAGARVGFEDHLCGRVELTLDDFVVRRNDGDFAYNLAVAVDDAEQGVGEVVRGADLLDTTTRQLWIYDRLGLEAPARFSHVPLMLGEDGRRLAKRHGAITLEERTEAGQSTDSVREELLASIET